MTTRLERVIEESLEDEFGVPFDVSLENGKPYHLVASLRTDTKDGFSIVCDMPSNVRMRLRLEADDYSRPLFDTMADASLEMREECEGLLASLKAASHTARFVVNGLDLCDVACEEWPSRWLGIDYEATVFPLREYDGIEDLSSISRAWIGRMLSPLFALLDVRADGPQGFSEGSSYTVELTKYERDPRNRRLCLEYSGTSCAVCGMDFERTYGPIGMGFIHVHHVVPVSQLGEGYVIDPRRDLVPVCPNCHSMLHRTDPPLLPGELRSMLRDK